MHKERKKNGYSKNAVRRTKHWEPTRLFKHYDDDDDEDDDDIDSDVDNDGEESTRRLTKRWNIDDDDATESNDEQKYIAGRDYIDEDNLDKYRLLFW